MIALGLAGGVASFPGQLFKRKEMIMFESARSAISEARRRRKNILLEQEITRKLDAEALSELGYPPKALDKRDRPWFLYL